MSSHSPDEYSGSGDAALAAALADREAQEIAAVTGTLEDFSPGAATVPVSPDAYALIVRHETGGRAYYERIYKGRPVWPTGASGVTIGFGYDLGYVDEPSLRSDWMELGPGVLDRLSPCVGKHGGNTAADILRSWIAGLADVSIDWDGAAAVFHASTLPVFVASTWRALPNCDALSADRFGALVSLTFNRGPSYAKAWDRDRDPLDRYREMRAIRAAMADERFDLIPGLLRSMERIWRGQAMEGEMTRRREDEAALFERDLQPTVAAAVGVADDPAAPAGPADDETRAAANFGIDGAGDFPAGDPGLDVPQAFDIATIDFDVPLALAFLADCEHSQPRVAYGLGCKIKPGGIPGRDFTKVDCSGFVREVIRRATDLGGSFPDGSVVQHEWVKRKGFAQDKIANASARDGAVRIAFLPPGATSSGIGHVVLVHDGVTMESHGGIGPDSRPWNGMSWQASSVVYVLSGAAA